MITKNNNKKIRIAFVLAIFMCLFFATLIVNESIDLNQTAFAVDDDMVKVHFININRINGTTINDVGDCTLIQDHGINILIDSGKTNEVASAFSDYDNESITYEIEYLKAQGVEKLDYVINTHAHEDHISGLFAMIREFTVTKAVYIHELDWENVHPSEINVQRQFFEFKDLVERQVDENGEQMHLTEPIEGVEGRVELTDDSYMEFYLLPTSEQNPNEEINHTSLIVYYVYKDFKILITGDSDSRLNSHLKKGGVKHCQIFQAQHHTASTGNLGQYNSQELFDLVTPDVCIIPAHRTEESWFADNDTFGNFKRLKENNITTYSTGLNGTIVISSDGSLTGFTLKTENGYQADPMFSGKWRRAE